MAKKKKDTLDAKKLARKYGLAYGLFKHEKELYGLLQQAVKHSWTAQRFTVEVQNSKWFKTNSASYRQMETMKYADPQEYQAKLAESRTSVQNIAGTWGAGMDADDLAGLAEQALMFGWNTDQIRDRVAGWVVPKSDSHYGGELSAIEQNLRTTAQANGVRLNDAQVQGWMRAIVRGDASSDQYQTSIRDIAAQTFSAYGDQIKAGMNLQDLASPYLQSMGQILEINPGSLDLFDPTIRGALGYQNDKGEQVPMSITAFEKSLRQDKRYGYTKQAKDQARGLTSALGQMWGLTA